MSPERIWYGHDAAARLVRGALVPLSGLYWLGWQTYLALYKVGLKKAKEPHHPVVCIGNLSVGGTGKSPTSLYVAKVLQELGYAVTISASGYGSPASEGASVAPDGELQASKWGDEPAMIRWLMPDVPLIVGRNRVEAAGLCHEHFPDAVLLMDDGLQHLPLKKHVTIALDSGGASPFVLPAGPYREPLANLAQFDMVLTTDGASLRRADALGVGDRWSLRVAYSPTVLCGLPDLQVETITGRAAVLTAIAKPKRFIKDLESEGLFVAHTNLLSDHDPMTAGNLFDGLPADLPLIVTAKDWVKLRERKDMGSRSVYVAMREARIEPEDRFKAWLQVKLHDQA